MERVGETFEGAHSATASVTEGTHAGPFGKLAFVDGLEAVIITILIAIFGTTFIVQAFRIPSESMEPTLLVGDRLLVNKFIFGGEGVWYEKLLPYRKIRHGDIVIFKFPYDEHPDYVKRVIGLPGDRVRIKDEQVYINENPIVEPYTEYEGAEDDPLLEKFPLEHGDSLVGLRPEWAAKMADYVRNGELVVPSNSYFVLGDNRGDSLDSRYWGFVSQDSIIGRPIVIYWSMRTDDSDTDTSLFGTMTAEFEALAHTPSRTRWNRILREVH